MVWYSHLFQSFPQFIVIHTVKGFGIVNKTEMDVFLELSCFFDDPEDVGKGQFSFQSQRKAMPKNAQTTAQLHSSHTLLSNAQNSPSQASAIREP